MVRNPLDSITSLFNMMATVSHSWSIKDEDFAELQDEFDEYLRSEISVWHDFHMFWAHTTIPVHIVRFEDLVTDPERVLKPLLEFILDEKDITGTKVYYLMKKAVGEQSPKLYPPRQGKINANLSKFNQDQLRFISDTASEMMTRFRYHESMFPQLDAESKQWHIDNGKAIPAEYQIKD